MRRYVLATILLAATVGVSAADAREQPQSHFVAASADLDVRVIITAAASVNNSTLGAATAANGDSRTVNALNFTVGLTISNNGLDDAPGLVYGVHLPAGLHWRPGQSDPECTFAADAINCQSADTLPNNTTGVAYWKVTADAPGNYVISAHASSSAPDPDPSDNSVSATAVVQLRALAGAAKVTPKRPKAGSLVSVRVGGVTVGGDAVAPTAVSCSGTIGGKRIKGSPRPALGAVRCTFRTPPSAKGKQLRGAVSFTAGQTQIRRAFAVKLR